MQTFDYLPPEEGFGYPSDVWSAGAIILAVSHGRPCLSTEEVHVLRYCTRKNLHEAIRHIDGELQQLICSAKVPVSLQPIIQDMMKVQLGDRISALQAYNKINVPPGPGFDYFHRNPPTFKSDFQLPKAPTREYVKNDNRAAMRILVDGLLRKLKE